MHWHDVSMTIRPGMMSWPGDPLYEVHPELRIEDGAKCNLSSVRMCLHTGTHVDSCWHFVEGAGRTDANDPALFFGDALVVHVPAEAGIIEAAHLPAAPLPRRVLFRTRNSERPEDAPFDEDFVALSAGACERLVAGGVRLVGVDGLSIDAYRAEDRPAHYALLGAGILVVEGLRLGEIPPGIHPFTVLPLKIAGLDGAPCRAFIGIP